MMSSRTKSKNIIPDKMCVYCKSKKASALLIVSDGYSDILKPTTINWCGKCKPYKIEYEPECKNGDFDLPDDLNKLRVVELRGELRARDMSTRGRKRELVQRLETALEDDDEDEWCCLPDDLGELLVVELKEELRDRDMSTRGRKSELVQRLEAALEDGYDTDCTMPN